MEAKMFTEIEQELISLKMSYMNAIDLLDNGSITDETERAEYAQAMQRWLERIKEIEAEMGVRPIASDERF
ncbi:hypothetical protein HHE01_00120 [Helicobacter heilmannii]|uniref:Uncharacterized protein n=2 Tax=Helicobacter heilmannii TaxID=35817 RepID=A0A0K2Y923_HELHE|nr:hypothetical protein [Helicobacter heilmannii]CCM12448.1 hypothetical protein BN341_p190 [Helicobacter heilmannii ASB1.4]CRI35348.1 hypothetical protein HHE01_00120 [Helicobacter heilmannii]